MAIRDALNTFSDGQAVTITAASTNRIDFGSATPDTGDGKPKFVPVYVGTAFATLTSLTPVLQESADDSAWTTLLSGPAVAAADLTAGALIFTAAIPVQHQRYLRFNYVVAGSAASAGTITATISTGLDTNS